MADEFEEILSLRGAELEKTVKKIFSGLERETPTTMALEKALAELFRNNASVVSAVASRLRKDMEGKKGGIPPIVTILAPETMTRELAKSGFTPMPGSEAARDPWHTPLERDERPEDNVPPGFLRCPFKDIAKYCHRPFRGQQDGGAFTYELVPAFSLLAVEKTLQEFGRLYRQETPLIFSPWSRRAVYIQYLNGFVPQKDTKPDLLLHENELENILLPGYTLFWNGLLTRGEDGPRQGSSPDGNRTFYTATYEDGIDASTFILPVNIHNQPPDLLNISREPDRIRVESPVACGNIYYKLVINPFRADNLPEGMEWFANSCDAEIVTSLQRPRTVGEIKRLLNALRQSGFSAEYKDIAGEVPSLTRYDKRRAYPVNLNERLLAAGKTRPRVNIAFGGGPLFLEDYAEYILNFLEKRYPEYEWKGVPA